MYLKFGYLFHFLSAISCQMYLRSVSNGAKIESKRVICDYDSRNSFFKGRNLHKIDYISGL